MTLRWLDSSVPHVRSKSLPDVRELSLVLLFLHTTTEDWPAETWRHYVPAIREWKDKYGGYLFGGDKAAKNLELCHAVTDKVGR